jgi:hypothetical protein
MGFGRMTANADIPPANGNQIKVLPGRVQSVKGPFNFDTGSLRAIAFIYYLRYNNTFTFEKCIVRVDGVRDVHLRDGLDELSSRFWCLRSNLTEAALNKSAPTVDDDHGAGTEAFAHEIEIGFRKIFGLPDSADGQRLAGFFK